MMGPINVLRGTQEAAEFFDVAVAEFEGLVAQGLGPLSEERFRTVVEGPPPYPFYKNFRNLFAKWGAVAVQSTYSTVGGIWEWGFRHDPRRPLESIAEQMLSENLTNRSIVARYAQIKRYVEEWEADALVIHSIKSCRLFSAGQGDMRDYFTRELGVPTLMVESDLEDPRYYAEAQIKNRIDAFFESLEHKKVVRAAGARAEAPASEAIVRKLPGPIEGSSAMTQPAQAKVEKIPVYCYQCVAGPDLLKVVVQDGVAVGVEPNCDMADVHPAGGKVCVRAYGLVQKLYNPARVKTPMRRTNPREGPRRGSGLGAHPLGRGAGHRWPAGSTRIRGQGARRRGGLPATGRDLRLGRHRPRLPRHVRRVPRRLGARGPGHRQRPGRQVLSLRAPLRRVLAPRLHGGGRRARAATSSCPSATTATPPAASPASSVTPRRGRAGSTGCSSSRISR